MFVCICHAITDQDLRAAVANGASSLAEISESCTAGTDCGSCHFRIKQILKEEKQKNTVVLYAEQQGIYEKRCKIDQSTK